MPLALGRQFDTVFGPKLMIRFVPERGQDTKIDRHFCRTRRYG
jgi:hypothetical protein